MPMLAVLSAVAGFVDAACFLALSEVFTAHVTGNFAALASALVKPDVATLLRLAVIASFAIGAASAVVAAHGAGADEREPDAGAAARVQRAVIGVEVVWLALVLVAYAVLPGPLDAAHPLVRFAVASFAGAAMGCQSALSKLPRGAALDAPTTVMTSNFTAWVMALATRLIVRRARRPGDRTLGPRSLQLALFLAGAAAGAFGVHRLGIGAMVLPLAVLLVILVSRLQRAA